MKLTVGKRIVMFIHSLMSILLCVALGLRLIVPNLASSLLSRLEASMGRIGFRVACVALLVIYAGLAIAQLSMVFNRKKERSERGFIAVDSGDTGRVRIAVSAVEQMVRQSVRGIDGINEMKISIEGQDDAIAIAVNAAVASGSHVPTLTRNMQRSIREFVEVHCGVAVNAISISIDAVSSQSEGIRQRIWGRGKADKAIAPTPAPEQGTPTSFDTANDDAPSSAASEPPLGEWSAGEEAEPASYDVDRPYESEFAKDLAAMRAQEASDAAEASVTEGDSGTAE